MTPFVTGVEDRLGSLGRGKGIEEGIEEDANVGGDRKRSDIITDWNSSWPELTRRAHRQIARSVYVPLVAVRQAILFSLSLSFFFFFFLLLLRLRLAPPLVFLRSLDANLCVTHEEYHLSLRTWSAFLSFGTCCLDNGVIDLYIHPPPHPLLSCWDEE